jgi:hypothetical protein
MDGLAWLQRLDVVARYLNINFDIGSPDMERMLAIQQAEAAVFIESAEYTVVLRANPTASAVLEEIAHCLQARRSSFSKEPAEEIEVRREIAAKECLVMNAAKFEIPEAERVITESLLERDRANLARIQRFR